MKLKGLGRGLDALMPDLPETTEERVVLLDIGEIDPNPQQPRRHFDQAALKELSDSIRQVGVLQPILVCEAEGRYRIIAGERRWRASRLAELEKIPAIVRSMSDVERMEAALIENLQRQDLNPVEEAAAIRALMDECGLTQEMAAQRLGRSRPALANLLRILSLPERVIALVRDGKLSAGHARALAALEDPALCEEMALRALAESWSVRQLEQAVKNAGEEKPRPVKEKPRKAPEFTELEDRLRLTFGMKAQVQGDLNRGRITLQYTSREALERLFDALGEQ